MVETVDGVRQKRGRTEGARETRRVTATLDRDEYERLKYWAAKHECSVNEYMKACIEHMIAWEAGDFDLPTAEIQRLNQLVDGFTILSRNLESLEGVITSGFDSLLGLTRGDNYLLDDFGTDEV